MEPLESRQLLAVVPPTDAAALIRYLPNLTNEGYVTFTDNNQTETGYLVEWSDDGDSWPSTNVFSPGAYTPGGFVEAKQLLDAGQKRYYRVRALEGATQSSPSVVVSPLTPVDLVVQIEAEDAGNGIRLTWPPDSRIEDYFVYRKLRSDNFWTALLEFGGDPDPNNNYLDTTAAAGSAYEYRVYLAKRIGIGVSLTTGYVYAGRGAPLVEDRGRVLMVVDQTKASVLQSELETYKRGLIGDGWRVERIDVAPVDVPRTPGASTTAWRNAVADTKQRITAVYNESPSTLKAIVLIGHVPVPYSGVATRFDGHPDHTGAWSTDTYYGEFNGTWDDSPSTHVEFHEDNLKYAQNENLGTDGKFDEDRLPSDVEVPVARIDFANDTWSGSTGATEDVRLKRYFEKNHRWRVGEMTAHRRALIDDHFGSDSAFAGDVPWRSFAPLVGRDNTHSRNWSSTIQAEDYLWAFGQGPGNWDSLGGVVYRSEFAETDAAFGSVFNIMFGSWFADFDLDGNIMRGYLGTKALEPTTGTMVGGSLVVLFGGRPNWFLHPMGLGEPISTSLLIAQNNSGLYEPPSNYSRAIDASLQGDPTLRMHVVKPVTNVTAKTLPNGTRSVSWAAPAGTTVAGYRISRAATADGPFVAAHTGLWTSGTTFTDSFTTTGQFTYMVRAVKLEDTPSGTYYNASTGVFAETTAADYNTATFDYGGFAQKIAIAFDRNVVRASPLPSGDSNIEAADLNLTKVGDDSFAASIAMNYAAGTSTATFTFSNVPVSGTGGGSVLPDGNYRATVAADDIVINGEPMFRDVVLDFFVLNGDVVDNHEPAPQLVRNRVKNSNDFNRMVSNYGQSGKTYNEGNFNYDAQGLVNSDDFNILTTSYGVPLDEPPVGSGAFTLFASSTDEVTVTWVDDQTGETGWRIQVSEDGVTFGQTVSLENQPADPASMIRSHVIDDLDDGHRYYIRLRAYSTGSGTNTAYTPKKGETTPLPPPTDLLASRTGTTANLSWSVLWGHHADNAIIQRSTNGIDWTMLDDPAATQTTYADSGLSSGRYYYRIYLTNGLIDSAPSFVEYIDVP
jgi:hypothetical protein